MAYDETLAARMRNLLASEPGLTERKMFGGLAFFINGNMTIAASGHGGILVRVDPADTDALIASTPAKVMVMRGRNMTGWLRVSDEHIASDTELKVWVKRALQFNRSLPPKS